MDFDNEKVRTSGIKDLLDKDLVLPYYQRQYSWTDKNVRNLLSDISNSINDKERFGASFRYRIGTIILYNNADTGKYEIVDGQQRIITLFLLKYYLEGSYDKGCELIKNEKWLKASEKTLRHSYKIIQDWFSGRLDEKESYKDALDNILEVVIIIADDISEAFQMFDSQNSRGK